MIATYLDVLALRVVAAELEHQGPHPRVDVLLAHGLDHLRHWHLHPLLSLGRLHEEAERQISN